MGKLLMEVCTTLNGPAKGFIPVLAPSMKTDITEFRVALIESDPVCPVNEETRTLVKSVARRLRKLRCAVITENIELIALLVLVVPSTASSPLFLLLPVPSSWRVVYA